MTKETQSERGNPDWENLICLGAEEVKGSHTGRGAADAKVLGQKGLGNQRKWPLGKG